MFLRAVFWGQRELLQTKKKQKTKNCCYSKVFNVGDHGTICSSSTPASLPVKKKQEM